MTKLLLSAAALVCLAASTAAACEPCPRTLGFNESVAEADLVIIGERTDYSPVEATKEREGPDFVKVRILELFKGTETKEVVEVNSWDGMCQYGIVVAEGKHLMILKRGADRYDSVELGCGVKSLPVVDGKVSVEDKALPLSALKERIASAPPNH